MSDTHPQSPWPAPARAWYVVGVLFIAYIFSYCDRIILALLVEPIRTDLALSDTRISVLHGFAFVVFYTLLGVPLARLADRYSRIALISAGIVVWSLASAACGLASSFWELAFGRVMVGVGEAVLSPAAYSLIADYFPPERRGRASGFYAAGAFFGAGTAFLVGGLLVAKLLAMGAVDVPFFGSLQPWQLTFAVVGLPGLLVATWVRTLREPMRREIHASRGTLQEMSRFLHSHRRLLLTHFLGFSFVSGAFCCVVAWVPSYFIRVHDFDAAQAGFSVGSALAMFGTAGVIAGGWFADFLRRRGHHDGTFRVGILAGTGTIPFVLVLGLEVPDWLAVAAIFPLCFFATLPFGSAAAALQQVVPNRMRAQIIAIYFLATNLIGAGLIPVLTALLTDRAFGSPDAVGISIATVAILSGLLGAAIIALGLQPLREALSGANLRISSAQSGGVA